MDNAIYEYIKYGITINGNPIDGYKVFTIPTQHFHIDSLHQLTPETFEREIQEQKEHDEFISEIFKEVQNEIDQMDTTDRLFKQFMETSEGDPDLIWNKEQFVDMLLTDDEFYQEWGEDCCEELTYTERYNIWIGNNYETGIEYNPEIIPDFENDYYEPTPKRKLK
jgi:hypothetical protein